MLTKTANEMIGRRAKVKTGDYRGVEGSIDRVTLSGAGATVRLMVARAISDIYVDVSQIDYCSCGEGDHCYLCVGEPANV